MSTYGIWGGILAVEKSLTDFTTVKVKLKSVIRIVFGGLGYFSGGAKIFLS